MDKQRYVKVQLMDGEVSEGSYIALPKEVMEEIDIFLNDDPLGPPVGDSLVITGVEMTEDEYKTLPEFTGW